MQDSMIGKKKRVKKKKKSTVLSHLNNFSKL